MKKLYWRPQKISSKVLLLVALIAVVGIVSVEKFKLRTRLSHYQEKIRASKLAQTAFDVVKQERLNRGIPIDPEFDPADTGLVGALTSPTTTNKGNLTAKQTSVDPNFAAVVVQYLKRLGVGRDSVVAVGMSGSFPAVNIAVLAALETLEAKPFVIASVGSSQFGANIPEFLWPDIETVLGRNNVFKTKSLMMSCGGIDDRALGLSPEGRNLIESAINRNGYLLLKEKNYKESVDRRMATYRELAGDKPIKAYINVGGGTSSVGSRVSKARYKVGINRKAPIGASELESVMTRFVKEGVPVIHLDQMDRLAQRYGLPSPPKTPVQVGVGKVFMSEEHNKWLAGVALAAIFGALFIFVRLDWGFRLLGGPLGPDKDTSRPEPMI